MESFSIELAAERIYDSRTREYFDEVLSSYINGNYRSAIVMLWSVVVCDLVYKLMNLRDIYDDPTAETILQLIEQRQTNNPNSPDWELQLLNEVRDRTELIDNAEYGSLAHLQNRRHLSAHPILTNVDLLFRPNRETTRALMREALESILLKPPILTKKITITLVVDIAAKKDLFPDNLTLKRYLEAKYFRNLRPAVENNLFRSLWKFVFRLSNPDTDENRDINYRTLKLLYLRRPNELRSYIRAHQEFFSEIGQEDEQLQYLIDFVGESPLIYDLLTDSAKIPLQTYAQSSLNAYAGAVFLNEDIRSHLQQLNRLIALEDIITSYGSDQNKIIGENTWNILIELAQESNCTQLLCDIAVNIHVRSGNFDFADLSFERYLKPLLSHLNEGQLERLIEGIDNNDQAYARRRAQEHYELLYKSCSQVLGQDFDYTEYPNIRKKLDQVLNSNSYEEDEIPF
ncbi:MAG: hypothetical protein GY796_23135 [Chloroflexi bacterium]|nr:hypothetical protein [Chloroflexota bacterium]